MIICLIGRVGPRAIFCPIGKMELEEIWTAFNGV